jgi:hypothetical protein
MTAYGSASALGAMRVARDSVGVGYHADTHTHIDALCHIAFEGLLYDGTPAATRKMRITSPCATSRSAKSCTSARRISQTRRPPSSGSRRNCSAIS